MEITTKLYERKSVATETQQFKSTKRYLSGKIGKYVYRYKYILSVFIFLSVLLSPQLSSFAQAPSNITDVSVINSTRTTYSESENFYLKAVNQLRSYKNLSPVLIDRRLTTSAQEKALDMSDHKYWGHYSPAGTSFADFIWANSPQAESVGENLAKCYASRLEAFEALVASPTHYAIMTGRFSNFGVSELVNKNDRCVYTVMHFSQYQK